MKYIIFYKDYFPFIKRYIDASLETEADSVHDAALNFSKHIHNKSVAEIETMINDQIAQEATEQDYAYGH